MNLAADSNMVKLAKKRGPVLVQYDEPTPHEVVATLLYWTDKRCRVEFVNGACRTMPTDRVRPVQ